MSSYHSSTPVPLPIRWMSPEALSNKCFSEASDVWSYGVLQWEMFNPNELPYDSLDNFQVFSYENLLICHFLVHSLGCAKNKGRIPTYNT